MLNTTLLYYEGLAYIEKKKTEHKTQERGKKKNTQEKKDKKNEKKEERKVNVEAT